MTTPFAGFPGGVKVHVRVAPRSAANRIHGFCRESNGTVVLKIAVVRPPEGGKANAALIRLLAKEWRVAKSALAITSGKSDRRKTITVAGDPHQLLMRLAEWSAPYEGTETH